jgi:hypothetical protein
MTQPIDPRSTVPTAPWPRWRRFFHLEGRLGSLRYEARLSVIDLQDPTTTQMEIDTKAAAASRLLRESDHNALTADAELNTWESEGGAAIPPRR